MQEAQPQQTLVIVWLLNSGGFSLLVLGLMFAVAGIVLLIWPSRALSMILAFLSTLPAVIALIAVYTASSKYAEMASASTAPKPAEFAAITGKALSFGFCGLLGTLLSTIFAVLALARANLRNSPIARRPFDGQKYV